MMAPDFRPLWWLCGAAAVVLVVAAIAAVVGLVVWMVR